MLGVAQARFDGAVWPDSARDFDFGFASLIGLGDPLRPEIPDAMRQCVDAAIRVVMVTGDYPATAEAIALQAGLRADALVFRLASVSD